MKFGVEFSSRSVPRWKVYNIDYNLLKSLIREATTEFNEDLDSSSNTDHSTTTLNDHQKSLLKKLYKNFKDQIDFVSLFVFSKIGELSRRLSVLKRQCNLFLKSDSDLLNSNLIDLSLKLRKKKILSFNKELNLITKELQDLSRFILLQKIAIKKLLKKFNKYSSYTQKYAFTEKISKKFLIDNPKSFIHVNLNDLTLETTLLYDFLDSFITDPNKNSKDRQSSIITIDSLQLTTNSYLYDNNKENSKNSVNQLFPKSTTFDIVSKKKGPRSLTFWIHNDNLEEVKMLLSSEFKLITDDTLITKDIKLKNTKSSLNLNLNNDDSNTNNRNHMHNHDNNNYNNTNGSTENRSDSTQILSDSFCPETDTLSIWLNNPDKPLFVQKAPLDNFNYNIKSIDNLKTFKADPYSQILSSNLKLNQSLLMTPIGGLRQFTISLINESIINALFLNDSIKSIEKRKQLVNQEWLNSGLKGNQKMSQLSFDWVLTNNMKPLASIESKKLRYINLNKNEKIDFYLSLEWNIKIHKTNDDGTENPEIIDFPYAILEINFDIPESEFPNSINSLINSYLVYRVDNLNFSLNNFLIFQCSNLNLINDDEMLIFIAPWHNILENKDIRILPEMRTKSRASIGFMKNDFIEEGNSNSHQGILLNKDEIPPSKPGYWNEFDNGSEGEDNGGFYVYYDNNNNNNDNNDNSFNGIFNWISNLFIPRYNVYDESSDSDLERELSDPDLALGLDWISKDNTDKLINWVNNSKYGSYIIKKILGNNSLNLNVIEDNETTNLLNKNDNINRHIQFKDNLIETEENHQENYNADAEDDDSESENEALLSLPTTREPNYGTINSIKYSNFGRENHDKIISFFYMVLITCSILTSSIGTLIVSAIVDNDKFSSAPQITFGITVLIIFAIICLVLSIIFTGLSLCLLLCRYSYAPSWHVGFVWLGTVIATCFFFYGITICI